MSELSTHEKLDLILEQQANIQDRLDRLDETVDWMKDRLYDLENDWNSGYSVEDGNIGFSSED